jgi:hypothetical protein
MAAIRYSMSNNTQQSARHQHRGGRRRRRGGQRSGYRPASASGSNPLASRQPSFLQKVMAFFGFGPPRERPPAPRADRPTGGKSPAPGRQREAQGPRGPVRHEVTSGRLYVGNLSYDTAESDLHELFSGVGQVRTAEVVYHRHNHRSKGYAFVEMSSVEEARRAVEVLNEKEFMGRKLLVSGARPNSPSSDEGRRSRSSAAPDAAPDRALNADEPTSEARAEA